MNKIKLLILSLVVAIATGCGGPKNAEQAFADGDLKNGSTEQEVNDQLGKALSTFTVEGNDDVKGVSYVVNGYWYDIYFKLNDDGTYVVFYNAKSEEKPFRTSSEALRMLSGDTVGKQPESDKEPSEFKKERAAENIALKKKYDSTSVSSYPTSHDEFTTSDLKMCGLCGHVKEIKGEAMFDKAGKLIKFVSAGIDEQGNETDVDKFTRDGKGRIVGYTYDRFGPCHVKLQYDSEGYVSELEDEADGETTYSYRNGLLDSFEDFTGKRQIRYTKFDSHGNWIECIQFDGQDYFETKRTIIYY